MIDDGDADLREIGEREDLREGARKHYDHGLMTMNEL